MMKYIYLILALIFFGLFWYFFIGNRLNRSLNIKKRQIAVNTIKNKYTKAMFISACCFFVCGMLFVIKVISRDYDALKEINNSFEYQESYKNQDLQHLSLDNSIRYLVYNHALEDDANVYYFEENYIYKFNLQTNNIYKVTINNDYQIISIYQNNNYLISLAVKDKTTRIDIISKYDLSIKNTLIIDGTNELILVDNQELNIIVSNIASKNSYQNGYFQNKANKVTFKKMLYIDCTAFDKILTHLKVTFDDFKVKNNSICVADEFITYYEDLYITFNSFTEGSANNKIYVLKYSLDDMKVANYRTLNGVIYSTPYIVNDRLAIVINDLINNQKRIVKLDKYLNVLESHSINLLNQAKENSIVINDKYVNLENVLYYDSKYLLGYYIDNKFIYITEYIIELNASHEYRFEIPKEYQKFIVLNCVKQNNILIFSYQIDEQFGYYYLNCLEGKYGLLEIFSDNKYYITVNNIISNEKKIERN